MLKYEKEIVESLQKFSKYSTVIEKLKEAKENEAFEAEVQTWLEQEIKTKNLESFVASFATGECPGTPSDQDLFQETQRIALEASGNEWTLEAARLAVGAYLAQNGRIDLDVETVVTFGELYGLKEDSPLFAQETKLSSKDLNKLEDTVFVGPNRTVPVRNFIEAVAAIQLFEQYGTDDLVDKVIEATKGYGVGFNENKKLTLYPFVVDLGTEQYNPLCIESKEILEFTKTNLDSIAEAYGFDDSIKDKISAVLETYAEIGDPLFDENIDVLYTSEASLPEQVVLGADKLVQWYESSKTIGNYLRPLVGAVRKLKISKEALTEYESAYKAFDPLVLEVLLKDTPVPEAQAEADTEIVEETGSLPTDQATENSNSPKPFVPTKIYKRSVLNKRVSKENK